MAWGCMSELLDDLHGAEHAVAIEAGLLAPCGCCATAVWLVGVVRMARTVLAGQPSMR